MPYVQRGSGVIVGVFTALQPGFAEEFLPDDNPEVMAFLNPPTPIDPELDSVGTTDVKTTAQILGAT